MTILYNASALLYNHNDYGHAIDILGCLCEQWKLCIVALVASDMDGKMLTQILAVAKLVRVHRLLGQCHTRQGNVTAAFMCHQRAIFWDTAITSCVPASFVKAWVSALCDNTQAEPTTNTKIKSKAKRTKGKGKINAAIAADITSSFPGENGSMSGVTYTVDAGKVYGTTYQSIYQLCLCAAQEFDSIRISKKVPQHTTELITRFATNDQVLQCSLLVCSVQPEESSAPSRVATVLMVGELLQTLKAKLRLHATQRRWWSRQLLRSRRHKKHQEKETSGCKCKEETSATKAGSFHGITLF